MIVFLPMTVRVCLGIAAQMGGGCSIQPDQKEHASPVTLHGPPDPRVAALLDALEAHERSIENLHWKQKSYTPPNAHHKSAEWVLLETSERYVDSHWRWLHRSWHGICSPPEYVMAYPEALHFGDSNYRLSFGVENNQGVLTEPDGFFAGGCHLWRSLGRSMDYDDFNRTRAPSEFLRRAKELVYLEPTVDEPWPGVRGNNCFDRVLGDIEVRVDPEYGLAPRLFRSIRRGYGTLSETLVVLEYQTVDGVSIPKVGINGANYDMIVQDVQSPLSKERLQEFDQIMVLTGLPDEARTEQAKSWVKNY